MLRIFLILRHCKAGQIQHARALKYKTQQKPAKNQPMEKVAYEQLHFYFVKKIVIHK